MFGQSGTSQIVLLVFNGLIFLFAVVGAGLSIYLYTDEVANVLTFNQDLHIIIMTSVAMIVFAVLGCYISQNNADCVPKFVYLFLLGGLVLAEVMVIPGCYNVRQSFQVAKDRHFSFSSGQVRDYWAVDVVYSQLSKFYYGSGCAGGGANSTQIPIKFNPIICQSGTLQQMKEMFMSEENIIRSRGAFEDYSSCVSYPKYTLEGATPLNFTQAFCGALPNIVNLAQAYSDMIFWFFVGFAVVIFFLAIATLCKMGQSCVETDTKPDARETQMPGKAQLLEDPEAKS